MERTKNTMKIAKRPFTLLLAASMLLAMTVSCSEIKTSKDEETQSAIIGTESERVSETEKTEDETPYVETLEKRDLEGYTYRIVAQHTASLPNFADSKEFTGEVVNDAIITRNHAVAERLNIEISDISYENRVTLMTDVAKTILAGDDAYDLVITSFSEGINTMVTQNCFLDLTTVPHLTLESERWNKSVTENMRIDGRQFFTTGVVSASFFLTPQTVIFNKRLAADNNLPDLYECALEGKWTVDMMNTCMKGIAQDLNGNGQMDPTDDRYAFVVEGTLGNALYMAGGLTAVSADEDGKWTINIDSEESINLIDKCAAIFNDPSEVYTDLNASNTELYFSVFTEGRSLFTSGIILHAVSKYRDMQDDFGILPIPVFNEGDPYRTACNTWAPSGIAIPLTCQDTEKIGLITETLAAYSYDFIAPAMIEKTLGKVARDSASYQIMMTLYDTAEYDFNTIMNFSGTSELLRAAVIGAEENFTSVYQKNKASAEKALEKFIKSCRELSQVSGN